MKKLVIRRPNYVPPTRLTCNAKRIIWKFWKFWKNLRPLNNTADTTTKGCIRLKGKDVLCPILQDVINRNDCFKIVTRSGHVQAYDAISLARYFRTSNNFSCPCTRQEFTRNEVYRLRKKLIAIDALHEYCYILGDFEMRTQIRKTQLEYTYRSLAIENSCSALMTECIDTCSNLGLTTQEAAVQLLNFLIPEWKQLVDDFCIINRADCKVMLAADKEKLIRLARSDLHDPHGLLRYVMDAVNSKIQRIVSREQGSISIQSFINDFRIDVSLGRFL
jgi:hypothetical protein